MSEVESWIMELESWRNEDEASGCQRSFGLSSRVTSLASSSDSISGLEKQTIEVNVEGRTSSCCW